MRERVPSLILITDCNRYPEERLLEQLEPALQAGLDAVLLREKALSSAKLLALASKLRAMTAAHGARLYIHTQADIAAAVDADGVHVASGDISNIPAIRHWLSDSSKTVSASCHSAEELADAVACGADFALLSPVFPTQSHPGEPHLGLDRFNRLADTAGLPVVALGGIDAGNRERLAGRSIAVIGAILDAGDAGSVTTRLRGSAGGMQ